MSNYLHNAASALVLCAFATPIVATSTQAQTASGLVELPPIEITTPSPVARTKAAAKANAIGPEQSPAKALDADLSPPPGTTLVVADEAFVPVTVATAREIEANGGASLADTLATKPGVAASTFAPGASRPIIRGLDSYRVRLQEDGIGSHDVSALSEDHQVPIDPFAADKVEVVRGPATLRYGSGAIGGVVAVENERIPTKVPQSGANGVVRGSLSSVDDGSDGAFSANAGAAGIVVHADAFSRNADDYLTPRGRQENSFVDSQGGAFGASVIGTDGYLGVAYVRNESIYGIPGEEAGEESPRIDLEQDKVLSKGEWRIRDQGIEALRYWFGASDYEHLELAFLDPAATERDVGSRFTNKEQEVRLEIQHQAISTSIGEFTGAIGTQWGHRRIQGESFEGDSLLEPATTGVIAAFWFEELQATRRLRLQAAARIESNEVSGQGIRNALGGGNVVEAFETDYTPVSASAGALYDIGFGMVTRLNAQYVERAPDAAELFSKGVHEATSTFEIGNPDLGLEVARTVELGVKRASGALRFDATAFYTRFDGYIFRNLTGDTCGETLASCVPGDAEELALVVFGQRDARFYGLEIAGEYDVAPIWGGIWGIDGQYDIVRAEFTNGEKVQRIPPQRLGGGLFFRNANWFARAGLLHAFDQNQIGANEIATPGYTLVQAEASYTYRFGNGPEATIGIKGENLADDDVLNHASFKRREGVLEPGASVRLFGSVKLN